MRLFRRIGDILTANLNDLVERFEDPESLLRQAVREMDEAVAAARDSAVKAVAEEKLLARQAAEHRRQVETWHQRALRSVHSRDEVLARRALTFKLQHERLADALEDQQLEAQRATVQLRRQLDGLHAKLAEARRRLAVIAARRRMAEARRQCGELANGSGGWPAATVRFDDLNTRLDRAEAEAEAWEEWAGEKAAGWEAEEESAAVTSALAELKEQAGG